MGIRHERQAVETLPLPLALPHHSREARQAGRVNLTGAAYRDVRRFWSSKRLLPKIPGLLADPAASLPGAALECVSLVTFFAQAKKVIRATRETPLTFKR
jgi:hypothetical protein